MFKQLITLVLLLLAATAMYLELQDPTNVWFYIGYALALSGSVAVFLNLSGYLADQQVALSDEQEGA